MATLPCMTSPGAPPLPRLSRLVPGGAGWLGAAALAGARIHRGQARRATRVVVGTHCGGAPLLPARLPRHPGDSRLHPPVQSQASGLSFSPVVLRVLADRVPWSDRHPSSSFFDQLSFPAHTGCRPMPRRWRRWPRSSRRRRRSGPRASSRPLRPTRRPGAGWGLQQQAQPVWQVRQRRGRRGKIIHRPALRAS